MWLPPLIWSYENSYQQTDRAITILHLANIFNPGPAEPGYTLPLQAV